MAFLEMLSHPGLVIREFAPAGESEVQELFAAGADQFRAAPGDIAAPGDVQSLFYAAPEGAELDAMCLLVLLRDELIIGLLDAVLGHCEPDAVTIGLFLLHPQHRRAGLGHTVGTALTQRARELGFCRVSSSTPSGWEPGRAFLEHFGFMIEDPELARHQTGNRYIWPRESAVLRGTIDLRSV